MSDVNVVRFVESEPGNGREAMRRGWRGIARPSAKARWSIGVLTKRLETRRNA